MSMTRDEWDEQCGRWRWPEGENIVVWEDSKFYQVLDEVNMKLSQFTKTAGVQTQYVAGDDLLAQALRDYLVAHGPKPWHEAKPGEVRLLESENLETAQVVDGYSKFRPWGVDVKSNGNARGTITAGRRIWPEAADA